MDYTFDDLNQALDTLVTDLSAPHFATVTVFNNSRPNNDYRLRDFNLDIRRARVARDKIGNCLTLADELDGDTILRISIGTEACYLWWEGRSKEVVVNEIDWGKLDDELDVDDDDDWEPPEEETEIVYFNAYKLYIDGPADENFGLKNEICEIIRTLDLNHTVQVKLDKKRVKKPFFAPFNELMLMMDDASDSFSTVRWMEVQENVARGLRELYYVEDKFFKKGETVVFIKEEE